MRKMIFFVPILFFAIARGESESPSSRFRFPRGTEYYIYAGYFTGLGYTWVDRTDGKGTDSKWYFAGNIGLIPISETWNISVGGDYFRLQIKELDNSDNADISDNAIDNLLLDIENFSVHVGLNRSEPNDVSGYFLGLGMRVLENKTEIIPWPSSKNRITCFMLSLETASNCYDIKHLDRFSVFLVESKLGILVDIWPVLYGLKFPFSKKVILRLGVISGSFMWIDQGFWWVQAGLISLYF